MAFVTSPEGVTKYSTVQLPSISLDAARRGYLGGTLLIKIGSQVLEVGAEFKNPLSAGGLPPLVLLIVGGCSDGKSATGMPPVAEISPYGQLRRLVL